jgi:hypothetical protein
VALQAAEPPHIHYLAAIVEDQLMVTSLVYALPDMDFAVHLDDSCPPNGTPVLSACARACRGARMVMLGRRGGGVGVGQKGASRELLGWINT